MTSSLHCSAFCQKIYVADRQMLTTDSIDYGGVRYYCELSWARFKVAWVGYAAAVLEER